MNLLTLRRNEWIVAWMAKGEAEQAIACYREALRLKPDHPNAHNNLGNAYLHKGDADEAIACFDRALKLKPDHLSSSPESSVNRGLNKVD